MKYSVALAAFFSPFVFPFPATILLSLAASIFFPPVALLAGLLTDFLYYTPGASAWPVASTLGLFLSVLGLFVRRFLKARIIGG